ncbi:MAG: fimbrillin family protein [Bacteroidales bacterium]|nr:fimbrillin family protein [Bacteroidales bacterium]
MKKYFIIAIAALVASAACTKTEVSTLTPNQAISFQVANYVGRTRASESLFQMDSTFKTSSWFHENATAAAQAFMDNETVKWQSTNSTWGTDRAYFWPKTGWINFFSWTGYPQPTSVTEGNVTYTNAVIATDSNPMVASAAYHYSKNENVYAGDDYKYNGTDVEGVPTLFHHLVSQVNVIVKFDASDISDTNYKWDLVIEADTLNYANAGSLAINFVDPAAKGQNWPFTSPAINWTRSASPNVDLVGTDNLAAANKQTTTAGQVSAGKNLFTAISVLPQNLTATTGSAAKFSIKYTLTSYYNNVQHIKETVVLGGNDAIALTNFKYDNSGTPATLDAWNTNYRYTYILTIKPNKTVTFDPVVEQWVDEPNQPGYTYPNE